MPLQIDDLSIDDRHLTGLIFNYDKDMYFQGRALDNEGEEICKRLSKFKIGSIVEVKAESDYSVRQGVYEIYEIEIHYVKKKTA